MTDSNFTVSGEDLSDIFSSGLDEEVTEYKVGNANLKYRTYGSRHNLKKSNFVTNFLINDVDLVNTFEQEIIDSLTGTYGTHFNMIPVTNGCLLLMVNSCTITFKITHVNITAYIVGGGGGGGGSKDSNAGGGGGGGGVLVQSGTARNIKKVQFTLGSGGNGGATNNSGSNGTVSTYKTTNTDDTTKTFTALGGGGGGRGKSDGLDGANGGGHGSYSNDSPSVGAGEIATNIAIANTAYAADGVTLNCGNKGGSGQKNDDSNGSGGGGGGVNGVGGTNNNGGTNKGGDAYTVTIGGYTFHLGGGGGGGGGLNYGGGNGGASGGNGGSGVNGEDLTAGNASEGLVTGTTVYGFGGGGGGRGNANIDGNAGPGGAGGNGCCLLHIINSNVTFP